MGKDRGRSFNVLVIGITNTLKKWTTGSKSTREKKRGLEDRLGEGYRGSSKSLEGILEAIVLDEFPESVNSASPGKCFIYTLR